MAKAKKEKRTVEKNLSLENKQKAVSTAIKEINKKYGEGSIMTLSSQPLKMPCYPTGILTIDVACGIGGLPKGRIIEIYGPESSGKTTLALKAIATTQKNGNICAFIDAEHALNVQHAKTLGVDVDALFLNQPDSGEQALAIVEDLILSSGISLIVVDSVSALVPQAELDGEMGDATIGLQARLMSKAMRKLSGIAQKTETTIIFINQLREKAGGFIMGNPEVTSGGRALKFYSSIRMDVRRKEVLKNGTEQVGIKVNVKCVKNKVAPPFRSGMFDISFSEGIPESGPIFDTGVELDIIKKEGNSYFYNSEEKFAVGEKKAKEYLSEDEEMLKAIKRDIYVHFGIEIEESDKVSSSDTQEDIENDSIENEELETVEENEEME